jgi:hypothetical protein
MQTPSTYLPFDFGSWSSKEGLECPTHGLQRGGILLQFTAHPNKEPVNYQYCGACVIEMMPQPLKVT